MTLSKQAFSSTGVPMNISALQRSVEHAAWLKGKRKKGLSKGRNGAGVKGGKPGGDEEGKDSAWLQRGFKGDEGRTGKGRRG